MNEVHTLNRFRRNINEVFEENELMLHIIQEDKYMSEVMLTKENFDEMVLKSDMPVLVDFYAQWCGPCKALAPLISEIEEEYAGKIKVYRVDIDEQEALANYYDVMSVPTLLFFKDGEQRGMMLGYRPKKDIVNLIS